MDVLARCDERVIVRVGDNTVAMVRLVDTLSVRRRKLYGEPDIDNVVTLDCDVSELSIHPCRGSSCPNFGPRGRPPGGEDLFQQLALSEGDYPWRGHTLGWYCMDCSMPPR